MKLVFQFIRIFTGALFIFSGIVKLNDPSGFAIKLNEYFEVFAQDFSAKQDSVSVQCFLNKSKLIDKKYAIYAFDNKKQLEWHVNPSKNDNPPPFVLFEVFGQYGSSTFISEIYEPKPLRSMRMLVKTDKTTLYDKLQILDSNNTGIQDFTAEIDLSKQVKPESFLNEFFKGLKDYSLIFSILFCALEVILGFTMLISYRIKLTLIITALLVVFFTFLTGYSAFYNKVTDCGCFGDFLKLKPWDSFKKDIVLDVFVLFMFCGLKQYKPVFGPSKNKIIVPLFALTTFLFGIGCYYYLPVWDFLPYKKGNDIKKIMYEIPKGERASDSISIKFVLQKGSDSVKVTSKDYSRFSEKGYTFVRQDKQVLAEGYKSPIHDFAIRNQINGLDYKDSMLNYSGFQIMFVVPFLENTNNHAIEDFQKLVTWVKEVNGNRNPKIKIYGLTSASSGPALDFAKKYKLPIEFYASDQKMLMTMARFNPTLYLFKGPVVINKWSGFNLPSAEDLKMYCLNNKSNLK